MVTIEQALQDLNVSELVEFDENGDISAATSICTTSGELMILLEELQRYRDLQKKGLSSKASCLVKLPYPLGTKNLYFVDGTDEEIYILDSEKIELQLEPKSRTILYTIDCFDFYAEDFGKTVFLEKPDAEQALAKLK
jgi:hypothetical protein